MTADEGACAAALRQCSSVDDDFVEYLASMLADALAEAGRSACPDTVKSCLGEPLLEYEAAEDEKQVNVLCDRIAKTLGLASHQQQQQQKHEDQEENFSTQAPLTPEDQNFVETLKPNDQIYALYDDEMWHPARVLMVDQVRHRVQVQFSRQNQTKLLPIAGHIRAETQLSSLADIVDANTTNEEVRLSLRDRVRLDAANIVESFRAPTQRKARKEARAAEKQRLARKNKARLVDAMLHKDEAETLAAVQNMASSVSTSASKDVSIPVFSLPALGGGADLLSNTGLRLAYGRRYGLIGRNGVGKSTLLKAIARHQIKGFPSHLRVLHVEQEIRGNDSTVIDWVINSDLERKKLLDEEHELSQAADGDSATSTQAAERLEAIYQRLKEIDAFQAESRAAKILSGLQFTPQMQHQATKELSGGWRMRVALASALFLAPDLLLLDEPTNHLDFPAVLWLENYLLAYPATLLLVSHDRVFVNNVVTDVIHQADGQLTYYRGNYDTFELRRAEALRCQKKKFEAQQRKRAHMQQFIDRFRFNAKRASLVQSRIKALDRLGHAEDVNDDPSFCFEFPEPERLQKHCIQCDDVEFGYSPDHLLLRAINVRLDMDSRVALIGANGCGKSTLVNLMMGKLEPLSGHVWRNKNARIALFAQHHMDQLDLSATPVEYLMALHAAPAQEIRNHLGRFGVSGDLALQLIGTMSGGQKSRVAFANITWNKPHFIIMDEPTNHLDLETVDALISALSMFEGGALLISHDQHALKNTATEFWSLKNAELRTFASFEEARRHTFANLK